MRRCDRAKQTDRYRKLAAPKFRAGRGRYERCADRRSSPNVRAARGHRA